MVSVLMVEDRDNPFKGQEIATPVTIVEVPPVFVLSAIAYEKTPYGLKKIGEIIAPNAPKQLRRVFKPSTKTKGFETLKNFGERIFDLRLLVLTQPWKTGLGKKTPELLEVAISGSNVSEKIAFAEKVLGKEIPVSEVFQEGEQLDVIAVTKGKGWQGVVKRYGVSLNIRKASKSRRHGGSIGAERQAKVMYTIPRAGQMGFQRRTDRNKRILKISNDAKEFAPTGGFLRYGFTKSALVAIHGSIPGPVKRFVVLRKLLYPKQVKKPEVKVVLK